jgi:hypothetical protein
MLPGKMDALSALCDARLPATSLRSRLDGVAQKLRRGPPPAGDGAGGLGGQRAAAAPAAL